MKKTVQQTDIRLVFYNKRINCIFAKDIPELK